MTKWFVTFGAVEVIQIGPATAKIAITTVHVTAKTEIPRARRELRPGM